MKHLLLLILAVTLASCAKQKIDDQEDLDQLIDLSSFVGREGSATYFFNAQAVYDNDTCEVFQDKDSRIVRLMIRHTGTVNNNIKQQIPGTFEDQQLREFEYDAALEIEREISRGRIILTQGKSGTDRKCDGSQDPENYVKKLTVTDNSVEIRENFACGGAVFALDLRCYF